MDPALPPDLAAYAEHLMAGTGLTGADALAIARGEREADGPLTLVGEALRAGWENSETRETR